MSPKLDSNEIKSFLASCVLFQGADDDGLKLIADQLEHLKLKKGDPIILENELSDHVYFIYEGSAEVVKHVKELNQMNRLALLKKGSQFSEFSVLNRTRKGASVFALEDCEILRMSGDRFMEVLKQLPGVAKTLAVHIANMSHHIQNSRLGLEYFNPDSIRHNAKIPMIFPFNFWSKFKALPLRFEGQALYMALHNPENRELFDYFKKNHPQMSLKVYLINDEDFESFSKKLQTEYQSHKYEKSKPEAPSPILSGEPKDWMPKVSLFSDMPENWVDTIAQHLDYLEFAEDEMIFKPGDTSDKLYIVLSGSVDIAYPLLKSAPAELHVGTVNPGSYFSEVSLLTGNLHVHTARAKAPTKVAYLSFEVVTELLDQPVFTLPLARDLATRFQLNTSNARFQLLDPTRPLQIKELAALIPKSILLQHQIMPLYLQSNELTLGITNPESETIYMVISRYLHNYRVKLELIKDEDFKKWYAEVNLAQQGSGTVVGRAESSNFVKKDSVKTLDEILVECYDNRSSDIHIEPQGDCYVVRYRIDGVLHEYSEKYSKQLGTELISRIKVLCKMDVVNHTTPQDGQLKIDYDTRSIFARTSVLPTKRGENAVLRLIRERGSVPPITALAADRRVINILRKVTASKQGIFLVTGPTGSGKTTTLYSMLEELNRVDVSIISLEDPVEMEVLGTTQVEVNEKAGLGFAEALRSALRQDPNVIMVGEIRDEESAKIAFHAAATGHLVISTLHTNDSLSVVPRLAELGVSWQSIGANLIGATAQRLLRKNCEKCLTQRPISAHETELLKTEVPEVKPPKEVCYGKGCSHCSHTGFRGRLPAFEIWQTTRNIEKVLMEAKSFDHFLDEVEKTEFETLRQFALRMVCSGLTTFEEVEQRLGGLLFDQKQTG